MNPNSKDPITRMFAEREKESAEALEKLDKMSKIAHNMAKIMSEWNPDK